MNASRTVTTQFIRRRRPVRGGVGRRASRHGAAVVEFALVSPLLALLLVGMLELGRMFLVEQVLVVAAREGARVGAQSGLDTVTSQVQKSLADANLDEVSIVVTPSSYRTAPPGTPIKVEVSVPYREISWISPFFLREYTMSASATMRRE